VVKLNSIHVCPGNTHEQWSRTVGLIILRSKKGNERLFRYLSSLYFSSLFNFKYSSLQTKKEKDLSLEQKQTQLLFESWFSKILLCFNHISWQNCIFCFSYSFAANYPQIDTSSPQQTSTWQRKFVEKFWSVFSF